MQTLDEITNQARYDYVVQAILQCNGNKIQAAKEIGVSLATVYRIVSIPKAPIDLPSFVPQFIVPEKPVLLPISREELNEGNIYFNKETFISAQVTLVDFSKELVKVCRGKGIKVEYICNFIREHGKKPEEKQFGPLAQQ